jgi:acetyl-CoA C-acetyltransferase
MSVACGMGEVYVAGGIDRMTHLGIPVMRADMDMMAVIAEAGTIMSAQDPNPKLFEMLNPMELTGGVAAEKLVRRYGITRGAMDRWAHRSHVRAVAAHEAGRFAAEIVPVEGHAADGSPFVLDRDQLPRPDSSLEKIASLPPVYEPEGGTINAASASGQADGAAMVVVTTRAYAARRGPIPSARSGRSRSPAATRPTSSTRPSPRRSARCSVPRSAPGTWTCSR